MARMHHWIGISLLSFTLTGCVAQEKYNALKLDRDSAVARLGKADQEAAAARAEADAYKNNYQNIAGNAGGQNALLANLTQDRADLQAKYDELNRQYQEAVSRTAPIAVLPQPVSDALSAFAAQNPDLVEFDSARGIVKFKSDVTFNPGSSDLTAKAQGAIDRFAQILNSDAARGYELQVAGHTDSSPVANPETIRHGHLDNWYLSAHRAIAVSTELRSQHVSASRIQVAGYADQHPIASNATESGKAQNRRVEVLILPTSAHTVADAGVSRPTPRAVRPAAAKPSFNKDTAEVDRAPAMNK